MQYMHISKNGENIRKTVKKRGNVRISIHEKPKKLLI